MGETRIKATLDGNTISCTYYRIFDPGDDISPVDVSIQIVHQYLDSLENLKEIILETFTVLKNYLETKSVSYLSNQLHQKVDFTILNLRYLTNIIIKTEETRETVLINTAANLLFADDPTIEALPSNPQKDTENDENLPEIVPEENVVVLEKEMVSEYYALEKNGFSSIQTGMKIYLDQNIFILQEYNEESSRLFVENSLSNLIQNNKFTDQGEQERIPGNWSMNAPGLIVNSHILPLEDVTGINFWHLRITNPNLFSAFNSVTLYSDIFNLPPSLTNTAFSVYYRIQPTGTQMPFNNILVTIRYFFDDTELPAETITPIWSQDKNVWNFLSAIGSGNSITGNANKYAINVEIEGIDTSDMFSFDLCLPQVENSPSSTTRIIGQRAQDKITTSREILLEIPYYIAIKTRHKNYSRSLFSSTNNNKNGIEIISTGSSILLKYFDANGNVTDNLSSTPISPNIDDVTEYGVWITGTVVEFYLNKIFISSSNISLSIPDKTAICMIGSSERDNSTINDELLDFKILSSKP